MNYILVSCFVLFFYALPGLAQEKVTWHALSDVEFELQYVKEYDMRMMVPIFGEGPRSYEGREVVITGYIIPLDSKMTMYVLSRYPYAACFFCGGAGQESVVELWLKPEHVKRYKMDQQRTFRGIWALNDSDINHFNYILKDAEPYDKPAK